MSIRDYNKMIVITDCMTGKVIQQLDYELYSTHAITSVVEDIMDRYVFDNEHGISVKVGYKE